MELQTQSSSWIPGKFIGRGSYGVVTMGFRGGEVIAVKSAVKGSVLAVEALENEVEILRALSSSSPFIVEYYGEEETASVRSLFMEYLPGGDVARGGKVADVELIRSYTWCLTAALSEVHRNKVVHCDVKGGNVLVGATKGVAKLADFGSAKRVVDHDDDRRCKMVPRGSPLWMAPEVVRGESQLYESDVWSLGCTVIEMFTGKPAWQDNGAHTLYKIGYSNDLPEYPAQLPDMARDFLDKCLVRDAGQRWSCDQLLQHPFLIPAPAAGKVFESSPRSILDWDNVNFSDEDDDHVSNDDEETFSDEVSAKGRIAKLATVSGVNWESNGWTEVRNVKKEVSISVTVSVSVTPGSSSEYSDLSEGEDELMTSTSGVNTEFTNDNDNRTWINISSENDDEVEISHGGGDDGGRRGGGGSICRQVITWNEKNKTAVTKEILMFLQLITLYCSSSLGLLLLPNVTNLLFINLILLIHCFWIQIHVFTSFILFPFCPSFHKHIIYQFSR